MIQAKLGHSKPNVVSWVLWTFLALLNALSYREMSGNLVATLQFYTGTIACIVTTCYVAIIGKFSLKISKKEFRLFILGLFAIVVWWIFRSATGANMIVLLAAILSAIPTYEGVRKDPFKERSLPWMLWTIAFGVTSTNVVLTSSNPIALITPIVLIVAHGAIGMLATKKRKERFLIGKEKPRYYPLRLGRNGFLIGR